MSSTRPMLEAELAQHASALRALARLLVGEAHADDLVQDTTLQALRTPPRRTASLRGWLSQVLRRLALNHRRSQARRQQRETMIGQPDAPESAHRVAEHHEAVQRVTAALLGLPEPYHGTLLLRFFEDLTPTAIAETTGVPLATVKSRLQRGLVLLREHLDGTAPRSEWQAGLAMAFGVRSDAAVATTTLVKGTTGVLVMGSALKLAVAGAAAAAAWMVFSMLPTDPPAMPSRPQATVASAPVANAELAAPGEPANVAAMERSVAPRATLPTSTAAAPGPLATLRGRCIDEQGQPIVGVSVQLTSNSRGAEAMDAWTKDHDVPKDIAQKVTTAGDGVFSFQFWPAPPQQFFLDVRADGRATMEGYVLGLVEGRVENLGDIVMPPGVLVRGRLLNSDGAPVPNTSFSLQSAAHGRGTVVPRDNTHTRTANDGTFLTCGAVVPGDYAVRVAPGDHPNPSSLHLDGSSPIVDVNITIDRPNIDPLPTIRGVVVDESGRPVPRANIAIDDYSRLPHPRTLASTDDAGAFVLRQLRGALPEVSLLVNKQGYEELRPPSPFAWGRDDVRLVLQRALAVEVIVVADENGAPVDNFQVRVFPDPAKASAFSLDHSAVRARGHHEGGKVTVADIPRGDWCVLVEPRGDDLAISPFVPVRVADPGPARVVVRLPRRVERSVRVQLADETPVVGSLVELGDMHGQSATVDTYTQPLQSNGWLQRSSALLLHTALTDVHGEAVLRGPATFSCTLFVRGPGHVPTVVQHVTLDDEQVLLVTVSGGARLSGKVTPPAAIAELRRLADLPETGRVPVESHSLMPGIRLWRAEPANRAYVPRDGAVPFAEDGSFVVNNVPPGRWHVTATWFEAMNDATNGLSVGKSAPITSVDVDDDSPIELNLDLSSLLPGQLDGIVLLNDKPAANLSLSLATSIGERLGGGEEAYSRTVTTDPNGNFHLRLKTGDYRLSTNTSRMRLDAVEHAFVVAGQTTTQTFRLQSGTLRLRLLDAEHKPVPGVRIDVQQEDRGQVNWLWLSRTDSDGITTVDARTEPLLLSLLPKRLQDPKAQQEMLRQLGSDPFDGLRLELGRVTPKAGETTAIDLQLPTDWNR